jgi:predicted membrane protein
MTIEKHYINMKKGSRNIQDNNLTLGLILLVIGSVWLLKVVGIIFPEWMWSWPMIFVVLGLIILVKHKFQSGFGFFLLLFGTYFLIENEFHIPIDIGPYLIPVGLILLGLYIILNRKGNGRNNWKKWGSTDNFLHSGAVYPGNTSDDNDLSGKNPSSGKDSSAFNDDQEAFLASEAFFCGVQKRIYSKKIIGGKISAVFGKSEIDLRQSIIAEKAVLDVEIAFGGIKLIVPSHWDLQINVTKVFAGIEDKRMYPQAKPDPTNVLMIKGSVIFGGLEITSY